MNVVNTKPKVNCKYKNKIGMKVIIKLNIMILGFLVIIAVNIGADSYTYKAQWGSLGTGNGQFNNPEQMALDSSGNVYVPDSLNCRIQKFNSSGTFITTWGNSGSGNGQFVNPLAVAVDSTGNIYVLDSVNSRVQKFNTSGAFITTWGTNGSGLGQFVNPHGMCVDSSGNVYVADFDNNRIQKFDTTGTFITTWGSSGSGNGQFSGTGGIAVDTSGNCYVDDYGNNRIQKFDTTGTFITTWGNSGSGNGQFSSPIGICVDAIGNIYVSDQGNNRIQKYDTTGTFITTWGSFGTGNGQLQNPRGIVVNNSGIAYVADKSNNRIEVFSILPTVNSLIPSMGLNNSSTAISIIGNGFFGGIGSSTVTGIKLDDVVNTALTGITALSDVTINALVPAGVAIGNYNIKVTTAGGTNLTSTTKFTVTTSVPTVTALSPSTGSNLSATAVTITGTGFFGGIGSSTVTGVRLDDGANTNLTGVTTISDVTIRASVPAGVAVGSYNVKVTAAGGTNLTSTTKFTVTTSVPTVTVLSPSTGSNLSATAVTITGTGFFGGVGSSTVTGMNLDDGANTILTSVTVVSNVTIRASVPAGVAVGSYNVKVTAAGGTNLTSTTKFTVTTPVPAVTALNPSIEYNLSATNITITGTGFFGGIGSSTVMDVRLDNVANTALTAVTAVSNTTIYASVPAGLTVGNYNVKVTAAGGTNLTSTTKITITVDSTIPTGVPTTPVDAGSISRITTITFTWTQGTSADSESGIAGYYLQVGTFAGGSDKYNADVGNVLTFNISNCVDGQIYYARVRAKNGAGLYGSYSVNSDGIKIAAVTPILGWTGESGYASDGVSLDIGGITTTFEYRVKHTDTNNIALTSAPNVRIKKSGVEISGSPIVMSYISGIPLTGAIYSYKTKLLLGSDYSYYFEAKDIYGVNATGLACIETKGPNVISEIFTKLTNNLFNPTKPGTVNIRYDIPTDSTVLITVRDSNGEIKKTLLNESKPAGTYNLGWDGRDDRGQIVSSGMYIVFIDAGSFKDKKKVIIAK